MVLKDWKKVERGADGRAIWQTKNRNYGLVVNPMAWGKNKWHVGYNYILNPNHVDLGNDITKSKALSIAKRFMRTH